MSIPEFKPFPKMARLSREMIVTEKIDGTNASICITEDGGFFTGSRTRWITPKDDNYGFSKWAHEHKDELMTLGPGTHFGEWWGQGIQRNYGLKEKRFSLFNVTRWCLHGQEPQNIPSLDPKAPSKMQQVLPSCVGLVPVLFRGEFCTHDIEVVMLDLRVAGSRAAENFMKPEGVVVYHVASGVCFKKTIEKDDQPKGTQ